MYKDFKSFISGLYNTFVQKGETLEDSAALVVYILRMHFLFKNPRPITYGLGSDFSLLEKGNKFLRDEYEKLDTYKTLKISQIKTAVSEFLLEIDDIYPKTKQRTDSRTVKLIQEVIKKISETKSVIDLAIGKGSLLENLPNPIVGQDIDIRQVIIAEFFLSDIDKEKNVIIGDSISNATQFKKNKSSIFIFDPPMGDLRQKPIEWKKAEPSTAKKLKEIIGEFDDKTKTPSEILFLLNFLLNTKQDDIFIGLFPEGILTRNNKEFNNLRKYLINNCLIAVIKLLSGHVLLVGKNSVSLENYTQIPVIRLNRSLNNEQLKALTKSLLMGKNISFEEFYSILPDGHGSILKEYKSVSEYNKFHEFLINEIIYDRLELLNDKNDIYPIKLPIFENYETKYIKSDPNTIYEKIEQLEEEIKNKGTSIKNILSSITETQEISTSPSKEPLWFENAQDEEQQALVYFQKMGYSLDEETINVPQDFQIRENISFESYSYLKTLYECNRLTLLKSKVKINFSPEVSSDFAANWDAFYAYFNPLKEKNIQSIFDFVKNDTNLKLIYEDLCKYWMLNKDEEKTYLKDKDKKLKIKEITRALKVLSELGLLFYNKRKVKDSSETNNEMYLYESYIPNVKYINALRFKENQDV